MAKVVVKINADKMWRELRRMLAGEIPMDKGYLMELVDVTGAPEGKNHLEDLKIELTDIPPEEAA